MTEQELRALVREAIARAHGAPSHLARPDALSHAARLAPSHMMFALPSGADEEGPCIIEPAVMCTHCGYCKSMGH
jgi:hypothetical protein